MNEALSNNLSAANWKSRLLRVSGIVLAQIVIMQHLPGFTEGAWGAPADVIFDWVQVFAVALPGAYTGSGKA